MADKSEEGLFFEMLLVAPSGSDYVPLHSAPINRKMSLLATCSNARST